MLINVTVPIFNEERVLATNIGFLHDFLSRNCPFDWELVIADNASQDRSLSLAQDLAKHDKAIRVIHIGEKGRGRALSCAWQNSCAEVLTYMDVDLSTDLSYFPALIEPLVVGSADIAVGSRLLNPKLIRRGLKREFISRCYNFLIQTCFRTRFSDAQCGFKGITRSAAAQLLPLVQDSGWFFDTELLLIAEQLGYAIFDLPVRWRDDPDSRVKIISTAIGDLRGMMRVKSNLRRGVYHQNRNPERRPA